MASIARIMWLYTNLSYYCNFLQHAKKVISCIRMSVLHIFIHSNCTFITLVAKTVTYTLPDPVIHAFHFDINLSAMVNALFKKLPKIRIIAV